MVSIIMPVYNGEKYIKKSIESLINQTYSKWKLIIVNDGSSDNTENIIKEFRDKRISYIYQENKGQAAARNLALEKVNGKYIAFLDADDIYLKHKIKRQVEFLEVNSDIDVVYNDIIVIDESDRVIGEITSEIEFESINDFYAYILFRQTIPSPPTMMIRRSSLGNIKFPEKYRNAEDYKFIVEMAKKLKFKSINEILYLYRRHTGNVTNSHQKQMKAEVEIVKEIGVEEIKSAVYNSSFSSFEKDFLLAKILMKIEENKLAKDILLSMNEKNEYIFFYLGNINYRENNIEVANKEYLKALKLNPNLPEVHNNLGITEFLLGNKESAKIYFENALKINNIYMDANYNINTVSDFKITERELRKQLTEYN